MNYLVQSQLNCGRRNVRGDPLLCCTDISGSATSAPLVRPTTSPTLPPTTQPPPSSEVVPDGRKDNTCYGPDDVPGSCVCKVQNKK